MLRGEKYACKSRDFFFLGTKDNLFVGDSDLPGTSSDAQHRFRGLSKLMSQGQFSRASDTAPYNENIPPKKRRFYTGFSEYLI